MKKILAQRAVSDQRIVPGQRIVSGQRDVSDLEVRRISDHEWRVGDVRLDEVSADKILGFIQQRGETFEVFQMGSRGSDQVFDAWSLALGSFARLEGEVRNGTKRQHVRYVDRSS